MIFLFWSEMFCILFFKVSSAGISLRKCFSEVGLTKDTRTYTPPHPKHPTSSQPGEGKPGQMIWKLCHMGSGYHEKEKLERR